MERPRGRAGIGRQDRFRSGCSKERVGSTPSARTSAVHRRDDVAKVLGLADQGWNASEIARLVGIPRSTVRDWLAGRIPGRRRGPGEHGCDSCGGPDHRVYKLRIVLDLKYPAIVDECERAIRVIMPGRRKIHRQLRWSNYVERAEASNVEVYGYSKSWPCLFPQHGPGRKHERPIILSDWQRCLVLQDPPLLLRGLIHSDGCRFVNTGRNWSHPRYSFSNRSTDIRAIFSEACELAGLHWTAANHTIYVSRKADVEKMDRFIGPKR